MKFFKSVFVLVAAVLIPAMAFADPHGRPHNKSCRNDRPGYSFNNYNYSHGKKNGFYRAPASYYGSWYGSSSHHGSSYGSPASGLIDRGIRSGRLSNAEVRDLRQEQQRIQWQETAFRSDGFLSPRERAKLQDSRQDLWKDLNHNLNDGERRW